MKAILIATVVILSLVSPSYQILSKLSRDFLTGFESGLFIRGQSNTFKEYSCPTPSHDNE